VGQAPEADPKHPENPQTQAYEITLPLFRVLLYGDVMHSYSYFSVASLTARLSLTVNIPGSLAKMSAAA
jgi:hypothetical protein